MKLGNFFKRKSSIDTNQNFTNDVLGNASQKTILKTFKPLKVLTDEIEINPGLDFERLADTILGMIMGSDPQFSIGIYGEWGTGKTTLMKMVERKLHEIDQNSKKILSVWFNAWRYEREEQFAMIALMKTLAYGMLDHERYRNVSQIILNGLKIIGKDALRSFALETFLTEKGVQEFENELTPKMNFLNKLDKDTIYFDGLKKIEYEMNEIIKDNECRVVVFIDDLDRCSPQKALEVFESIKVFLDMKGFVYIIGLSHETIAKLITQEYEKSGIKGENYIRKIIQIPVRIPQWTLPDIEKLIVEQIVKKLDKPYSDIVLENKLIISIVAESNPRELKRFINNVMVALQVFSGQEEIQHDKLLLIEALKARWNEFYLYYSTEKEFREIMRDLLTLVSDPAFLALLRYWTEQKNLSGEDIELLKNEVMERLKTIHPQYQSVINNMEDDLWEFLETPIIRDKLIRIENWDVYRRITSTVEEISADEAFAEVAQNPPPSERNIQAYCVNCRKKVQMTNAKETKLKNGRPAIKGNCPECGTNVFRIGKT